MTWATLHNQIENVGSVRLHRSLLFTVDDLAHGKRVTKCDIQSAIFWANNAIARIRKGPTHLGYFGDLQTLKLTKSKLQGELK
tara:strand:+ start:292 stop:540 length:249 start_codon:yes stop_codon:yes gene_type:complete